MGFWNEVLAAVAAATVIAVCVLFIQWFLRATDITMSYCWRFNGAKGNPSNFRPAFVFQNRSKSKSYVLANIVYKKAGVLLGIDNQSFWGVELKPGTIVNLDVKKPVEGITSVFETSAVEIRVRLQDGSLFWDRAQGGRYEMGRLQRILFSWRALIEKYGIPLGK